MMQAPNSAKVIRRPPTGRSRRVEDQASGHRRRFDWPKPASSSIERLIYPGKCASLAIGPKAIGLRSHSGPAIAAVAADGGKGHENVGIARMMLVSVPQDGERTVARPRRVQSHSIDVRVAGAARRQLHGVAQRGQRVHRPPPAHQELAEGVMSCRRLGDVAADWQLRFQVQFLLPAFK